MTTDNYDVDALSNELDSRLSQLDNDINKQMENITSQLDGNNAKKKHNTSSTSKCFDDGNGSVNNHIVRYKEGEYGLIIDKAFPELD